MAEPQTVSSITPLPVGSIVPQKRAADDSELPTVASAIKTITNNSIVSHQEASTPHHPHQPEQQQQQQQQQPQQQPQQQQQQHRTKATGGAARAPKEKSIMVREPREKKESLKKREAKGGSAASASAAAAAAASAHGASAARRAAGTPDRHLTPSAKRGGATGGAGGGGGAYTPTVLSPLRYKLEPPRSSDYDPPRPLLFALHHATQGPDGQDVKFYDIAEPPRKKGYRYTHCIADAGFPHIKHYRQSETEPFHARFSFEDCAAHLFFDRPGMQVTTEKGFRMARANVCVREGRWYWECRIVSGIRALPAAEQAAAAAADAAESGNIGGGSGSGSISGRAPPSAASSAPTARTATEPARGHVRMGWARREASLDAPVGFDAYSYGLRDVCGQKTHMSRPTDFFPPGESIREGDVIGLEIKLPPLDVHRKIVAGLYRAAGIKTEDGGGDGGDDGNDDDDDGNDDTAGGTAGSTAAAAEEDADAAEAEAPPDVIRDRIPFQFKSHLYFEQSEFQPSKELEELMHPGPSNPTAASAATTTTSSSSASASAAAATSLSSTVAAAAAAAVAAARRPPHPTHPLPALRTLPGSYFRVYKNGRPMGTAFRDLLAFLPPASRPGGLAPALDDGMLGYFPAVSVFQGGAAEVNFGPDFWCPPPALAPALPPSAAAHDDGQAHAKRSELDSDGDVKMMSIGADGAVGDSGGGEGNAGGNASIKIESHDDADANEGRGVGDADARDRRKKDAPKKGAPAAAAAAELRRCRALSERYDEQIAMDVVYDLVDEADFWLQDRATSDEAADGATPQTANTTATTTATSAIPTTFPPNNNTNIGGGSGGARSTSADNAVKMPPKATASPSPIPPTADNLTPRSNTPAVAVSVSPPLPAGNS